MKSTLQIQKEKCANNIKVGTNIVLHGFGDQEVHVSVLGITKNMMYSETRVSILVGTNQHGTSFWNMNDNPGSRHWGDPLVHQSSNIDNFQYGYWITRSELARYAERRKT